ncbi:MAG: class I adenylate cyclase [Gammaproteobacteria bacterium]|nr:MAG: class I adenylate cyclase [Gammaproteobacteria bacterium]
MPSNSTEQPAHDIRTLRRRFQLINEGRLRRAMESLRPRQREILEILPLLFHVNYPLLPGYVSSSSPCGIRGYRPGRESLATARRLCRSFNWKGRALPRLEIEGIYMMGSSGTIAHGEQSDFDFWLCHREGLPAEAAGELARKARLVEEWANGEGLELHFFIFSPGAFREGRHMELSAESSGSSQHYLLLDEFYRSGVVLAGLPPAWWFVPREQEGEYQRVLESLRRRRLLGEDEAVDFGGLPTIPPAEFFGAALWQLYKGLGAPYKSLMKLLLMETYASEYPDIDLLSLRYKQAVHQGVTDLDELDPYLQMYRKVEEYLGALGDAVRLDLLRRCFYLKVGEHLSRRRRVAGPSWRRAIIERLTGEWGWGSVQIVRLDTREQWRVESVREEQRVLTTAFYLSYRRLSAFAREQGDTLQISSDDLTVLGRRLYVAFERKAGKIERIDLAAPGPLYEENVSIHQLAPGNGREGWLLLRGAATPHERGEGQPLQRAGSLCELLAWCHLNRIVSDQTGIALHPVHGSLSVREIHNVLGVFERLFPGGKLREPSREELLGPARSEQLVLFVNLAPDHHREEHFVASDRTCALSYGARRENLVLGLDLCTATSWGEVFCHSFRGLDGLMECLSESLRRVPRGPGPLPALEVHCDTPNYAGVIVQCLRDIMTDLLRARLRKDHSRPWFILQGGEEFRLLDLGGDTPAWRPLRGERQLLEQLGSPSPTFREVMFERHTLAQTPLPLIFRANREGWIQIFFDVEGGRAQVWILDERGALFHQEQEYFSTPALLRHNLRFLEAVVNRCRELPHSAPGGDPGGDRIEAHELRRGDRTQWSLRRVDIDGGQSQVSPIDVQVIGDTTPDGGKVFSVYVNGIEFSTLEHGGRLFEAAARHILQMRSSAATYPIHVSDIDLAPGLFGTEDSWPPQTIVYLRYKKTIEERLNEALERLKGETNAT